MLSLPTSAWILKIGRNLSCANLIHTSTWLSCSQAVHVLGFELPSDLPLPLQKGMVSSASSGLSAPVEPLK